MENRTYSGYSSRSLWPLNMPWQQLTTWACCSFLLSPITLLTNSMLLYALYKTKQLATITSKFIVVISVSDLCTGTLVLPVTAAMILAKDSLRSCAFQLTTQFLAFMFAYFSFFVLMCISLDRYIHVTKLNRYNAFMNVFRMKAIIVTSLGLSALIADMSIAFPSFPLQLILNCSDFFGVLLMCSMYVIVFRKIKFHAENFKNMLGDISTANANKITRQELSATKTIRVVLGALLVLYLPYNVSSAIWAYFKFHRGEEPCLKLNVIEYWSYLVVFSNAAVNAVIFIYGNTKTRNYIKNKFRKAEIKSVNSADEGRQDTAKHFTASKTQNV